MKALVQWERWVGVSTMIILLSAGILWLGKWITDSQDRLYGAGGMLGIIVLGFLLYWRLKNLNIENRGS